jgi:hypothetical protein
MARVLPWQSAGDVSEPMSLNRASVLVLLLSPGLAAPAASAAQSLPAPPPPLPAQPLQGVPLPAADPDLEAAIRARLFAGPPTPGQPPDPESTEWEQARAKGTHPDCREVGPLRYAPSRVDLNADGTPESLAAVVGSYACGSGGCTLMIFRRGAAGLEPISESGLFQSPLRLLDQRRGGWADLTMPALSEGVPSGEMVLRFDGLRYRITPAETPAPAGSTMVIGLPAVPFETLGLPLPCPG